MQQPSVNGLGSPLTRWCDHHAEACCVYCQPRLFSVDLRVHEAHRWWRTPMPPEEKQARLTAMKLKEL